jgi:hypothetical protein
MRVQIPAYTDRWMMGDRFGEVVKTYFASPKARDRLLTSDRRRFGINGFEMATVRLDKSGKTVRVILADCSVV